MGVNRVAKLDGRAKSRRYTRPNVAFLQAQIARQEKERQEKMKRGMKGELQEQD